MLVGLAVSLSLSLFQSTLAGTRFVSATCDAPAECISGWSDEASLLQSSLALRPQSSSLGTDTQIPNLDNMSLKSAERQSARLLLARPIAWVHVAKCGTSFVNALMYLPGLCDLPPSYAWEVEGEKGKGDDIQAFCTGSFNMDTYGSSFGDHSGVGEMYRSVVKDHGFIMLRQPEQRIISGWFGGAHSWPKWAYDNPPEDLLEYARVVSGCAVRMLTRVSIPGWEHSSPCGGPEPVTSAEVDLARHRLRDGFVFVGITDEWDLSMCLLHMVYGGVCLATDFMNIRPGENSSNNSLYDTSDLMGYTDKDDGALYDEALAVFSEQSKRYGVTYESCQPCFKQAFPYK